MNSEEHTDELDRVKVKVEHTETIPREKVQEWIDANALPGDKVVVTEPGSNDKTIQFVSDE